MARAEIQLVVIDNEGNAVNAAQVQINRRGSSPATIYQFATGAQTLANPAMSDFAGRVAGWLDRGSYDAVVSGTGLQAYTEQFEITPGGDSGIDTAWLADGAVTGPKIGPAAVSSSQLASGAAAANLGADTITGTHLAANSVGASELADASVDTGALIDGSVTSAKIADGTIAAGDLSSMSATEGQIMRRVGSNWIPYTPSGWSLVHETAPLGAPSGAITATSLTLTDYRQIEITVFGLQASSPSDVSGVHCRFNNDSSASYVTYSLAHYYGAGNNITDVTGTSSIVSLGTMPTDRVHADLWPLVARVFYPGSTTRIKHVISMSHGAWGNYFAEGAGGYWNSLTAITRIDLHNFLPGSGYVNWKTGSRFEIWGLRA